MLRWFQGPLDATLGTDGAAGRALYKRGERVASQARVNASGRPGPRVRTGRLRGGIALSAVQKDGDGLYIDCGTNVEYAKYVEPGFPFLVPALAAARG
jgi:hypothetical protein